MTEAWRHFHFLHPAWLSALLLLPPLLWWLARRGQSGSLQRLADAELLPHLLDRAGGSGRWPLGLVALAGVLAVLALAGPAWRQLPQPLYAARAPQVVAMSMSTRMLTRDVSPDRLARARYKVHALLDANRAGQNGLIAYAGRAFVVAPLTDDAHSLSDLLDALAPDTMPVDGNDAARAIRRGVQLLHDAGDPRGSLVLVTDDADAAAVQAAKQAYKQGVRVSVLGVGTRKGAPVPLPGGGFLQDRRGDIVMARRDDAVLRRLADAGGGIYVPMQADGSDVKRLLAMVPAGHGQLARQRDDARSSRWIDEGPWLLLPILLLLALGFRRGWLLLLPLAVGVTMSPRVLAQGSAAVAPAAAGSVPVPPAPPWYERLWQRPDQQAASALAEGRPRQAAAWARDPALRGAAAYRAGEFARAARAFADADGADAAYNRGNALAREGRYREALAAYDQALKQRPGMPDALANRRAVEDWMRQHRPPQQGAGARRPPPSASQPQQQGGARKDPGENREHQGNQHAGGKGQGQSATEPRPGASGISQGSGQAGRSGDQDAQGGTPDSARARRDQAQSQQARRELGKRMDQALQGKSPPPAPGSYALGQRRPDNTARGRQLAPAMQQALERVPDDPGGLLRRKFRLEYQRRQDQGGGGDQP